MVPHSIKHYNPVFSITIRLWLHRRELHRRRAALLLPTNTMAFLSFSDLRQFIY